MKNTFEELLERINEKRSKIASLHRRLGAERVELKSMHQEKLNVRLADFASEISKLSETNVLDMKIAVNTNIFVDDEEKLDEEFIKRHNNTNLEIVFESKSNKSNNNTPFSCRLYRPLDFNQIQADGKPLIDHCSIEKHPNASEFCEEKNVVVVNKDIGDIICPFRVEEIIYEDFSSTCEPSSLIKEVLVNCYNNQKELEKE